MDRELAAALTELDTRRVDLVITGDETAADWADEHGYLVRQVVEDGETIYEIWPGDSGPVDELVRFRVPPQK